jgi:hypothetical protein
MLYQPCRTLDINTHKIYVMTPQLQISTAGVYLFPAKTSGAKNRIEENI